MREITDIEVEYILQDIENRNVTIEDIKYNILDHVCCILEQELQPEDNFYKVYERTIATFYKTELHEIEQEAQQLVTFKYYYAMKKTLKLTSIASIILVVVGAILKTYHLQGAGVFILSGLVVFGLLFIPLNIVLNFRDDKKQIEKLITLVALLCGSITSMGVLFKLMHWPFANKLMILGLLAFTFIFIPSQFIVKYKNPETRFNALINTTFMICAAGMLYALMNIHGKPQKTRPAISEQHSTEKSIH